MKNKKVNKIIMQYLTANKHRWIKRVEIQAVLKINQIRLEPLAIRHHIKDCRLHGAPIIASKEGYRITDDNSKLKNYKKIRIIEIKSELKALRKMHL